MTRILLFTALISVLACKNEQKPAASTQDVAAIDSLVQAGIQAFSSGPNQAIAIFKRAAEAYEQAGLHDKAGGVYLNMAVIYEENSTHIDSAEYYAARSYDNFTKGIDSTQIMNVAKYYGFLRGANGQYAAGRALINEALTFYRRRNNPEGIAIAQYNLSRLAYAERNYGEAERLLTEARQYWKSTDNHLRVALVYMQEIDIALAQEDKHKAYALAGKIDSLIFVGQLPDEFIQRYKVFRQRIP